MDIRKLSTQLKRIESKVVQVERIVDTLKQISIKKGDKVKVVYPHLGIQGEYLVERIDNGVMELVAAETMKKIQE
ncbi:hypothetical protein [Bacillus cereus]|uniref:hypothetical protein n=1 Tax=Bacillus cereus TaxID=1396 RepID=UPI00077A5F1F|nr:hypothetical protein [Bacillus cereus]KXY21231.1 hypothetical protein AT273_21345 [Bacillus cereus]